MSATIIDGKLVSAQIKNKCSEKVKLLNEQGINPGLAVIIVGDDPASRVYVNNKKKDCAQCGIESFEYALSADTTQQELLALIEELNNRDDVNGILCQLPLPKQLDENAVIQAISPQKDVDTFHPQNVGRLVTGQPVFLPCTPAGVMELLKAYNIEVSGKNCVVIGRSNIVGKPMAMLLLQHNGTVTICHSKTKNLKEICLGADIIVSAAGRINMVTADMVKPGAAVIDVGINRREDGKLCGDVDFENVKEVAGYITPVPGGCGLMTRAMLIANTVAATEMQK
ncbi:MAG: bifunctional methylenetetrahydrofolate dehydrogenase/methenyltetrahydrofolate cyclohydrolase FolD [Clostridia bacterium]|nr:bifunctional methylenetetrahydrofolate dehydrogenase/methenyltetrahydrofolate cyclohydrolase FolD [Clostridia bacterium]